MKDPTGDDYRDGCALIAHGFVGGPKAVKTWVGRLDDATGVATRAAVGSQFFDDHRYDLQAAVLREEARLNGGDVRLLRLAETLEGLPDWRTLANTRTPRGAAVASLAWLLG